MHHSTNNGDGGTSGNHHHHGDHNTTTTTTTTTTGNDSGGAHLNPFPPQLNVLVLNESQCIVEDEEDEEGIDIEEEEE
ncbi:hypothetical protein PILCRDRAFT_16452 [Piloderma croceum F 1598]|uniref:Uncharacterized protein n=1 Tax=Piloderma croceum (strain F 1598) TaxID=765440 RepID=A0A0C3B4B6_PILCF|nr:hypothetical protein PILCRDRAFT_16452 [Piloderma croceum F 1598]